MLGPAIFFHLLFIPVLLLIISSSKDFLHSTAKVQSLRSKGLSSVHFIVVSISFLNSSSFETTLNEIFLWFNLARVLLIFESSFISWNSLIFTWTVFRCQAMSKGIPGLACGEQLLGPSVYVLIIYVLFFLEEIIKLRTAKRRSRD